MSPRFPPLGAPGLRRLMLMCVAIGVVAGLGAAAFFVLLEAASAFFLGGLAGYHPIAPGLEQPLFHFGAAHPETLRWVLLVLPALGGLVSGFIVFTWAPEAEGHGTDAAIEAYHFRDGAIRKRVPFIKALTAAITIGTGGSGGREGPIAQIGSGFASTLGSWLKVPAEERRVLMAAGMAAGVGAIFHAPFAGALFAAEVLYSGPDMEHEVFVPAFVTSVVAYAVFGAIFGFHPLFQTPDYAFSEPLQLLPYAVLGVAMAGGGWLFTRAFYGVRHLAFQRLRLPNHWKPMIGGLAVGLIGFCIPEALAAGYGIVQSCFNHDVGVGGGLMALPTAGPLLDLLPDGLPYVWAAALLLTLLAFAKVATTALSIGTGGSGGVFGPSIVIGGALGGALGFTAQALLPGLGIQPGAFALVGMAGFFAGAANTPISTIMMVSEMTGNYDLLVPSMLVCVVAFTLGRGSNLYERQLPSRFDAPSKVGYMARAILRRVTVQEALALRPRHEIPTVRANTPFSELARMHYESEWDSLPVVDRNGLLLGVIDDEDVRHLIPDHAVDSLVIAGDMMHPAAVVTPHQSMMSVVNRMATTGERELIVVEDEAAPRPAAILKHADVLQAYDKQVSQAGR